MSVNQSDNGQPEQKSSEDLQFEKDLQSKIYKFNLNKFIVQTARQLRSEAPLCFMPIREAHAAEGLVKDYKMLTECQQLSLEESKHVFDVVMNGLALLSSQGLYLQYEIATQVFIKKDAKNVVLLNPRFVTTEQPQDNKQVVSFVKKLPNLSENLVKNVISTNDFRECVFQIDNVGQVQAAKTEMNQLVQDAAELDQLQDAVKNLKQFIIFSGKVVSPPQIYQLLLTKLNKLKYSSKQEEREEYLRLSGYLIALHVRDLVALPSLEHVPEQIFPFTKVAVPQLGQSQAEADKPEIDSLADFLMNDDFESQGLVNLPVVFQNPRILALVLGVNNALVFQPLEFGRIVTTRNGIFVSMDEQNEIVIRLNEFATNLGQKSDFPLAYQQRFRSYLYLCAKIELDEVEKMTIDGVILKLPKNFKDKSFSYKDVREFVDIISVSL